MSSRLLQLLIDSFPKILLPGLKLTLPITAASFALALVIAVAMAIVQLARVPLLKEFCRLYIWIFRGTPLLVQLYIVFYGLPRLGVLMQAVPAAILVFALNTAAYTTETIRASIEAVPRGQLEAGLAAGMTYLQTMRRIVLPQAFRSAFPTLSSYLIGLVKDTSLAANITVAEAFMATQRLVGATYEPFALYCELALVYLLFSTVLTHLQTWGERRLAVY